MASAPGSAPVSSKPEIGIIKRALAWRAKYKLRTERVPPGLVVPHPKNRGGEPMAPLRVQELFEGVHKDGFDPQEANVNAVAVEDNPAKPVFQTCFEQRHAFAQNELALRVHGQTATRGSLSHTHLNQTFRNAAGGIVVNIAAICGPDGRVDSMVMEQHDPAWANFVTAGITWEVLSHKMDIEEPGAANDIQVSLNRKNQQAMASSMGEMISTMVGLINSKPHGTLASISYQLVRQKMQETYGENVEHPCFLAMFHSIVQLGGDRSPFMPDLMSFMGTFVNPQVINAFLAKLDN